MRWTAGLTVSVVLWTGALFAAEPPARPNILWISCEDTSPDLGCYGDQYAVTPNIDKLAADGVRYTRCFTHAGVCAPSRSGIITGCYPPSIGTHHMRCQGVPPEGVRCFTEYLRSAGYYCTNNVKTDYQFEPPPTAWNENSNKADWRGRKDSQPFFSVINFTTSHESQVRDPSPATQKLVAALPASSRHDPAKAPVWPFYPDHPVIRRDIANYYDIVSAMDSQVGEVLARLEADGLADDTIVWFWGDHGRGLSRCKRWLYDSGTHTPLIVRVPPKWRSLVNPTDPQQFAGGKVNDDLVAFVDFAPTVLSLAGVPVPKHFQGQAFLGASKPEPRKYVYGHRDRMDETYDLIRMVRDARFKYIRNFRHDLSYGQPISYMDQMPMMQQMRRMHAAGELTGGPAQYFRPTKPLEELFDTAADPHELNNLAEDPRYQTELLRLRAECERWVRSIGDIGLIPEAIFDHMKRPNDEWHTARLPVVEERAIPNNPRDINVVFSEPSPGAWIQYAFIADGERQFNKAAWNLYTGQFLAPLGKTIALRTGRIGYKTMDPKVWMVGKPYVVPTDLAEPPAHWQFRIQQSGILDELLTLRQADFLPTDKCRAAYRAALDHDYPEMRYWGVWAWTQAPEMRDVAAVADRLRELASNDPEPTVRIIAARALAMNGTTEPYVADLVHWVETHPQATVRVAAITALQDLDEKARPFADRLKPAETDGEYVGRIKAALKDRWK